MKTWKKVLWVIFISVLFVIIGGMTYLHTQVHPPTKQAQQVARHAQETNDWLYFPSKNSSKPIIIFYPGALVEPDSYSLWAQELANAGYPVYLLKMPFDLAILAPKSGEKVLTSQTDRKYVVGGHSLGGVMASRFAKEHPKRLSGVFFLASYPDERGRLTTLKIPTLSLTAENDTVLNHQAYQQAKKYLPIKTEYQEISGGNHAGFGSYGTQKNDGKSTINDQNEQVARRIITWLARKVYQ